MAMDASDDDGLTTWLSASGAVLDGVRIAPSEHGGAGVYTARKFKAGEQVFRIPESCVLSAKVACESALGQMIKKKAVKWLSDNQELLHDPCWLDGRVILWIYVAVAHEDATNPFHTYLRSLPAKSPDPCCWPRSLREELAFTPAGAAIDAARAYVSAIFSKLVSRLPEALGPRLIPTGCLTSPAELFWARGMCLSRAFPEVLAAGAHGVAPPMDADKAGRVVLRQTADGTDGTAVAIGRGGEGGESEGGAGGGGGSCLLPLFDVLNHRDGQPVTWTAVPPGRPASGIAFTTDAPLKAGVEVYNNYGPRSNEDLLLSYGFCIADNPHNGVTVSLLTHFPSASKRAAGVPPTRETYLVRRHEMGGVPVELLYALKRAGVALRRMIAAEEGEEGEAEESEEEGEDVVVAAAADDDDEEEDEELVLGSDEVQLLLGTLHERHAALEGHAKEDRQRLRRHAAAQSGAARKRKRAEGGGGSAETAVADSRAAPADARKAEAAMRRLSVAMYRQGMRQVLVEAMASLEELMGEGGEGEGESEE